MWHTAGCAVRAAEAAPRCASSCSALQLKFCCHEAAAHGAFDALFGSFKVLSRAACVSNKMKQKSVRDDDYTRSDGTDAAIISQLPR